ncbi:MAG: indole-3-glycerol phosphate synthase TrpC [Alphaproteobacteria bacterium]|nr:indole-3-glycerol phosphate synthase TrpC [Alphaproteobacteria bacterium]
MSDALASICAQRRVSLERIKENMKLADVERAAKNAPPIRPFAKALSETVARGDYALIAEIKKASPSAGLIRPDFEPANLAKAYERGGATCLSVLTEEDNFQGRDAFIVQARAVTHHMPVLRKDFMIDPFQVIESRALMADCILLILAVLDDALAAEMERIAFQWGMDVLIEVHDEAELERALKLKSPLIGINNRNLKTLKTDIATTERLAKRVPKDRVIVAESGLKTAADLARMARAGATRFLVGESLMREADVESATRALLAKTPAHA